jgi:hypothetical protein
MARAGSLRLDARPHRCPRDAIYSIASRNSAALLALNARDNARLAENCGPLNARANLYFK